MAKIMKLKDSASIYDMIRKLNELIEVIEKMKQTRFWEVDG